MATRRGQSTRPKAQKERKDRRLLSVPVTFETVRQMALSLEGVEEGTSYGTPAFRTRGELFARLREDPDSLVVRMEMEQREELMAADPDTYYITDHYLNYPWMLIRLSRVHPDALRDLLRVAWRLATSIGRGKTGRKRLGHDHFRRTG